mgnify:CR=1 FL=1|jgi:hypothetical protein
MDNYKQQPWYPLGGLDVSQAIRKDTDFCDHDFDAPVVTLHLSREQLLTQILDPDWVYMLRKEHRSVFDFRSPLLNAMLFWRHGHMNKSTFSSAVATPIHIDQSTVDGKYLGNFSVNHYALNWNIDYRPFWNGWKKYANDDWNFTESTLSWYKNTEKFNGRWGTYENTLFQGNKVERDRDIGVYTLHPELEDIKRWPRIKLIKILNLTASEAEMYSTQELREHADKVFVLEQPYFPDSTATMGEKPVLVNTSMPHQSTNKYPKLTLSLRWFLPGEDGSRLWPEAVDLFRPLITEY